MEPDSVPALVTDCMAAVSVKSDPAGESGSAGAYMSLTEMYDRFVPLGYA